MAEKPGDVPEAVCLWPKGAPHAQAGAEVDLPRLDPLLCPPGPQGRACMIVCPGGAYACRAGHEGEPVARWLAGLGMAACVLHYRVKPNRHPAPLADAQRAVRVVRSNAQAWGIDPARVGVLGFSAGGHLAASVASIAEPAYPLDPADPVDRHSSRPDALVACYPRISFNTPCPAGSRRNLLGDDPSETLIHDLSIENRVTTANPPSFLWHTSDDACVSVDDSLLFASALARSGVKFALHVFPTGRHGLGLAGSDPAVGRWTGLCEDWLARIGFLP